jgi:hypothetical protein
MSNPFPVEVPDHDTRLERVKLALDGLSVGDALGERFFFPSNPRLLIEDRVLPAPTWRYTDDTVMALCIAEVLRQLRHVDQEELAYTFARSYWNEPMRGYGATARDILQAIARGVSWRRASREAFDGEGSMGNGGAMRVAPVGAYYAGDLDQVVEAARASAEVTRRRGGGRGVRLAAPRPTRRGRRAGVVPDGDRTHPPGRHTRRHYRGFSVSSVPFGARGGGRAGQRLPGHGPGHGAVRAVVRGPAPGQLRGRGLDDH